jgi:hypothetical protein
MNTKKKTTEMKYTKILLVILWVFFSVNYIFCDIRNYMEPGVLEEMMTGYVADGTVQITQGNFVGNRDNMGDSVCNDCPVLDIEV